ncbi:MAG TPA: ABC transporter permease [Hyphomicrobiaceae bacterium]|nr:ABC transporter permease [Hyphomicrobiaceae bacterium]
MQRQREGSPWTGLGAVFERELADNLSSIRMRLLELIVFIAGSAAVYSAIGELKDTVGEDRFLFLRIFTVAREPLPSFLAFLGFLIPIIAIALGFDAINGDFNRRTMSRILAQPIYRDAVLFGKFLAGLATLALFLIALWLYVMGLGILMLGLPPSGEEIARGIAFLVAAVAYGGVWLAVALLFSVLLRSPASSALSSLSVWLLFAVFWTMIVPFLTNALVSVDPFDPRTQLTAIEVALALERLSPNTLFAETTLALLNPSTRALGPLLMSQLHGAIVGAPLPPIQSLLLIWPQMTGLIAGLVVLFTLAYVAFQRQEVRA